MSDWETARRFGGIDRWALKVSLAKLSAPV